MGDHPSGREEATRLARMTRGWRMRAIYADVRDVTAPIARLSSGWRSLSRAWTGIPQNLLNRLVGVDPS